MAIKITLQNPHQFKQIPKKSQLQRWGQLALPAARPNCSLTIRLVAEAEIRQLNSSYRQQDKATNILAFNFSTPIDLPEDYLGDLVLCPTIVQQEAQQQQKLLLAHWAHLIIHGILHLLGYDHQNSATAVIMEALEIQILHQLGFPNPY